MRDGEDVRERRMVTGDIREMSEGDLYSGEYMAWICRERSDWMGWMIGGG